MSKRAIGTKYESLACDYLTGIGMHVIERNYRIRTGEIDIVARDGRTLVFVEVKYRKSSAAGKSLDAVDFRKRMQIVKVAKNYLYMNHIPEYVSVRFDCIGIDDGKITHIRNAFDSTGSVS